MRVAQASQLKCFGCSKPGYSSAARVLEPEVRVAQTLLGGRSRYRPPAIAVSPDLDKELTWSAAISMRLMVTMLRYISTRPSLVVSYSRLGVSQRCVWKYSECSAILNGSVGDSGRVPISDVASALVCSERAPATVDGAPNGRTAARANDGLARAETVRRVDVDALITRFIVADERGEGGSEAGGRSGRARETLGTTPSP